MNILFNTIGYKPAFHLGGPIHSVSALAEGLAKRGHRVYVAATDWNLTERLDVDTEGWYSIEGVNVRYFKTRESLLRKIPLEAFRKSNGELCTPDFRKWLESCEIPFDVIHSHLPFVYSNRFASYFAMKNRIPYFYHQRGVFDPVRLKHRKWKKLPALKLWELPICRRANSLIALTEYEQSTYRKLGLTNDIQVIPNGIDLPKKKIVEWKFPKIQLKYNDKVVLFLSRLHPSKGADLAIEAFCQVKKVVPNVKLIVAGPDEYGIQNKLSGYVKNAHCEDSIFFTGPVSGDKKEALLNRADLFILPTESEGFSMAILEAMSHSCAILTTHGAHFPEIETENAGIISERNVQELSKNLAKILAPPYLMNTMANNARRLTQERYTWDYIVLRFERLYEKHVGVTKALVHFPVSTHEPISQNEQS